MKEKLTALLEKYNNKDIFKIHDDWYESGSLSIINEALSEIGADITFDATESAGILAVYYSGKIHQSIILDWDAYSTCNSVPELVEYLLDYQKAAEQIEKQLPQLHA